MVGALLGVGAGYTFDALIGVATWLGSTALLVIARIALTGKETA